MDRNKRTLSEQNRKSTAVAATVFLLPVAFMLVVYILYPIVDTFVISVYKWNGISADKTFIGIRNWKNLAVDVRFWEAFGHNLVIMFLSIIIQIPTGLALATFLTYTAKYREIGRFLKTVWFLPYLMSSVAIGFLFTYALATNGGIISTISNFFGGGNIDLLGNPSTVLVTLCLIIAWQFIPFYMVFCMAGYAGISEDIYEAAVIDGATRGQYFWKISLPLLHTSLISAAILSMVGSLKYFDLIYVMTNGGPGHATELMATYMYKFSFVQFNMGYGSTVAGGMFILITFVSLVTMKLLNWGEKD